MPVRGARRAARLQCQIRRLERRSVLLLLLMAATGERARPAAQVRVSVVIIKHIHVYITPVAALVLLCLHTALLVAAHVQTLPFHAHSFNLLRGGVYMVVLWAAFASAILSANGRGGSDTAEASMLQWSMISVAPVLFFVGLVLVEHQRERASQAIKQLRSEQARDSATAPMSGGNIFARRRSVVASLNPLLSQEVAAGGRPGGIFTPTPSRNRRMSLVGTSSLRELSGPGAPPAPLRPRRRDAYDEFFDFNSRMGRVFENSRAAHATARTLLYQKDQRDLSLLEYILQRAIEEHPDSHDLQILNLIFLRFVFQDKTSANWQEKITKMVNAEQPLDLKYTLYAVERKVYQLEYGLNLGKDSISAINMIEFSTKIEHVKKQNQECMSILKRLWKTAAKSKKEMSLSMVEDLIAQFDDVSHLVSHTDKCYMELVDKFSGSASLRRDYAEFCDIVLNDSDKAEMHRHGADLLESGDDNQEACDETRSRSSSNVSMRSAQRNFIQSWSSCVMGSEVKSLLHLRSLVLGLGFLLFVFSLLGFLVMEIYLYQNVTQSRLDMLQRTKGYRQNLVKSCIAIRSIQLAVNGSDPVSETSILQARGGLQSIAQSLTSIHTLNYVDSPTETLLQFFVINNRIKKVPMPGFGPGITAAGSFVKKNSSFWDFGNSFIESVAESSLISLLDLGNSDFSVDVLSINKRAVVFIFDNVWSLYSTIDEFFDLVLQEIKYVEVIAYTCAACLLTVNVMLIVVIAFFVVQSSRVVFPKCQHGAVGCSLIRALPHSLLRKVYRYYLASEKRRALIEDEDAARQNVIAEGNFEYQENIRDHNALSSLPHESLCPQLEPPVDSTNEVDLVLHESETELCKEFSMMRGKRKVSISFADTVGEILRLKMQPDVAADHHLTTHQLQKTVTSLHIVCEDTFKKEGGEVDEMAESSTLFPDRNHPDRNHAIPVIVDRPTVNSVFGPLTADNVRRYLRANLIPNVEADEAEESIATPKQSPLGLKIPPCDAGIDTHQQGLKVRTLIGSPELCQNNGSQRIGHFVVLDQLSQLKQSNRDDPLDSAKGTSSLAISQNCLEKIEMSAHPRCDQSTVIDSSSGQPASSAIRTVVTCLSTSAQIEYGTVPPILAHCQESTLYGRSAWSAAAAWRILFRRIRCRYVDSDDPADLLDHNECRNRNLGHHAVSSNEIKDGGQHSCSLSNKERVVTSIESKMASENSDDEIFVNISMSDLSEVGSPAGKVKKASLHHHPLVPASSSSKGLTHYGQSRQLGDSSRSLTAYAVEAISTAASSGIRRIQSVLNSSMTDVHQRRHPILKHTPSTINPTAQTTTQYEQTLQEDEGEDEVTGYVVQATVSGMKWFFRSEFHGTALLMVLLLCLCAWLLPLRILPNLVNTAMLSRQARDAGGNVLQCVFFARELILHDGLSRLSSQQLSQRLQKSYTGLQQSIKRLRLGGDGVVLFGADSLVTPVMDKYQAIMYQAASHGLYKLLVGVSRSVEVIMTKFNVTSEPSNYDQVITNPTLERILHEDADIKFLLEKTSQDATDGLSLIYNILMEEQARLFFNLHQENQSLFLIFLLSVIVVFYFVLFRTTMAAAMHEVERTRAFVNRIPAHIITLEELLDIRNHFDKGWMHDHEEDAHAGINALSRAGSFVDHRM